LSPAAAEAARGLAELEGVWGEVLGLTEGEGDEIVAEADELRGRLIITAADGADDRIVDALGPLRHAHDSQSDRLRGSIWIPSPLLVR